MLQNTFFDTATKPAKLVLTLVVPGRLPSWNQILGMEQWARYKFKQDVAADFLSALRATDTGCSTSTTSAKSTLSTYADTLESYLTMRREQRRLKSLSKKSQRPKRNRRSSKSLSKIKGPVPF